MRLPPALQLVHELARELPCWMIARTPPVTAVLCTAQGAARLDDLAGRANIASLNSDGFGMGCCDKEGIAAGAIENPGVLVMLVKKRILLDERLRGRGC